MQKLVAEIDHNSRLVELPAARVTLQLSDRCLCLTELFQDDSELPGILIFEGADFVTLISRRQHSSFMNQPFCDELFSRKQIRKMLSQIEPPAIILPASTTIGEAVATSLQRPEALLNEPLVITNGCSYSVIDVQSLLMYYASIFNKTVSLLQDEIAESNRLRSQLEVAKRVAEERARCDGLTNIANRRHMDEFLAREWGRGIREGQQISMIMIDIDHYKAYNDNYGHQSGDEALVKVAQALSSSVQRSVDLLARYGGEEFAVILPGTSHNSALIVAERLRQAVLALQLPHVGSPVHEWLSVSCGVATLLPQSGLEQNLLIARADAALYEAKDSGRNRVVGDFPLGSGEEVFSELSLLENHT